MNIKGIKFVARIGANFDDNEAMLFGTYMEEKGLRNAEELYADALANLESPFRKYLETDKEVALKKYNIDIIQDIIRHISYEVVTEKDSVIEIPRAYRVDSVETYVNKLSEEDWLEKEYEEAKKALVSWKINYEQYEFPQFSKIIIEIENIL